MHILGIFQQLVVGDHALEFLPGDEVVVHPVLLPHPGLPGGVGHGKINVGLLAQQLGDHGALSHPGGAGKNDQLASLFFPQRHTVFSPS